MPVHSVASLTAFLAAGSFLAGLLGSLTGLGGGVVLIPMMTLLFGIDIRYAIGASLVSVIATSSGAASASVALAVFPNNSGATLSATILIGGVSVTVTTPSVRSGWRSRPRNSRWSCP